MSSQKRSINSINNTMSKDLLIEIGLEELPPKNLEDFAHAFGQNLDKGFNQANLAFSSIETFIAPRRLAAIVKDLVCTQPEQTLLKRGPAKTAAFDSQGNPTQAAKGFAIACQTSLENIGFQETEKGSFLVFEQKMMGQKSEQLIPKIVQEALNSLPIAHRMRWGDLNESFVRPVHWAVLLFGDTVIPAEFFGIKTSGTTRGHRFHHPAPIAVSAASEYEPLLQTKGKVISHYKKRRQLIETNLVKTAEKKKAKALIDPELLDQVSGLVEWPVVLLGEFDPSFLSLPKEVLISSMQVHQKCFPVVNDKNELLSKFLIVSNIESSDPKIVIQGNERVMHARLQDAAFYYREDKKLSLKERQEGLKHVIFQQGLGTLWDKSQRIARLAEYISKEVGLPESDVKGGSLAAELCKTDLLTQIVLEFPELQGIMGRHYLTEDLKRLSDEDKTNPYGSPKLIPSLFPVPLAIEEHYHPRFAQDTLPTSSLGTIIAIADRIDSIVGLFGLGKRPTGDKDPFALRRQALAILRIILESKALPNLQKIDLGRLIHHALVGYEESKANNGKFLASAEVTQALLDFFYERLRAWYHEQGIPARVFDAVLAAKQSDKPKDFQNRLQALTAFQMLPEADSLAAANKRVRNILEKNAIAILPDDLEIQDHLLQEEAERKLAKLLQAKESEIEPLIQAGNYTEALKTLANLKETVDQFFDNVMVMVEDPSLRNNRLKLLMRLRHLFLKIADISVL